MKPAGYVSKYRLDAGSKFGRPELIADLTADFLALLETGRVSSKGITQTVFWNVVAMIRQKWDGINRKCSGRLTEGLWKFFYATVVAKKRDDISFHITTWRIEMQEKKMDEKRVCRTCSGSDQMIDEDFCPECNQPSADYKRRIERETIASGALDPCY